ncbi:hypothetical protein FQA39_LY07217 [Lamprigera yunnana]|nr:hypothetical protein FQA39_LY07217 [Lamprigera yunnana]
MEGGEWHLEAGALVLADGGICCIDEFNSIKSHDRASIHEVMEQQIISAGIHGKLRTHCAIIAATNPKGGHLDSFESLSLNLAISSSLLSHFDLVLMLKDTYRHEWVSLIADHILSTSSIGTTKEKFYLDVLQNSNITKSLDHSINNEYIPKAINDENFIPSKKRENIDTLNVSTINDSFNITKNSENLNEIPITDINMKRRIEISEMRKKRNKNDSSNILNLIKSVHDDFDLNFVNNISQEVADFNLNTQTRNMYLKQFSDDRNEKNKNYVMKNQKLTRQILSKKAIPNEETSKMKTPVKESPNSRFKFVPRNLPSTTTSCASTNSDFSIITSSISTMLNSAWDNYNIFQTEDIDLLDFDI